MLWILGMVGIWNGLSEMDCEKQNFDLGLSAHELSVCTLDHNLKSNCEHVLGLVPIK